MPMEYRPLSTPKPHNSDNSKRTWVIQVTNELFRDIGGDSSYSDITADHPAFELASRLPTDSPAGLALSIAILRHVYSAEVDYGYLFRGVERLIADEVIE